MEIIPAVLAKNLEELVEIQSKLLKIGGPLHIDIADGQFVSTLTVGREEIADIFPEWPIHVHFMVTSPADVIKLWLNMDNLLSVIFHIEATDKAAEIIDTVHQSGKKVGIAINPHTQTAKLEALVGKVDFVHFMTVQPGDYGALFQKSVLERIAEFHTNHPEVHISADGGIVPERVQILSEAGVSTGVVGSYIVNSSNPEQAFKEFNS